jgi:hypothetical protein
MDNSERDEYVATMKVAYMCELIDVLRKFHDDIKAHIKDEDDQKLIITSNFYNLICTYKNLFDKQDDMIGFLTDVKDFCHGHIKYFSKFNQVSEKNKL